MEERPTEQNEGVQNNINDINLCLVKENAHLIQFFPEFYTSGRRLVTELQPLTLVVGGLTVDHAIYLYFEIICFNIEYC